jgi:Calponin homology (CH) domain/Filamin/ABP280 repeat
LCSLGWVNNHLKDRGMAIEGLKDDLCNGLALINLLEIISGKSLGRHDKHPRIPLQKVANVSLCLQFLKSENIKLVNIGPEDIVDGNLKLILGLIWTLVLRYQINKGGDGGLDDLLKWVQSKIPHKNVTGFTGKDWNDGTALGELIDALEPNALNAKDWNAGDKYPNALKAMDKGQELWGIPKVLAPEEMNHPKVDAHAVAAYISYYRDAEGQKRELSNAQRSAAYGDGLVEGIVNTEGKFRVDTPGGKLEVKVVGPSTSAQPKITNLGNGSYDVAFTPTEPGEWEVHVTVDGEHIPGSVFHVRVLQEISAGGEGRLLIFFSTTSSTNKGRADVMNLQRLLEAKGADKRGEGFLNFVPIDILTKVDRDAIFTKVGVRNPLMVLVDDKYVGDYDALQELEEQGKLDALLNI